MEISINNFDWAEAMNCAVTVCDAEGTILYMNSKSRETFASHGDLIGKNLFECHSEPSQAKIRHMLATGESNAFTRLFTRPHGARTAKLPAWWKSP